MPEITVSMAAGRTEEQKIGMMRDITQALVKNLGVDADMVKLEGPIRECALYAVKVNLGHEIESEVKVLVVRQQEKK